jgi:hypothetical protein
MWILALASCVPLELEAQVFRGVVVDDSTHKPLSDVTISVEDPRGRAVSTRAVRSGEDGIDLALGVLRRWSARLVLDYERSILPKKTAVVQPGLRYACTNYFGEQFSPIQLCARRLRLFLPNQLAPHRKVRCTVLT